GDKRVDFPFRCRSEARNAGGGTERIRSASTHIKQKRIESLCLLAATALYAHGTAEQRSGLIRLPILVIRFSKKSQNIWIVGAIGTDFLKLRDSSGILTSIDQLRLI